MNEHDICSKTTKGLAELAKQRLGLTAEAYFLLGSVDGRATISQLQALWTTSVTADATAFDAALRALLQSQLVRLIRREPDQDDIQPDGDLGVSLAELDTEQGVQAWAEAKRYARELKEKGFFGGPDHAVPLHAPPRILVVEDDPVIAQMEMLLLDRSGCVTQLATRAQEVAPALARHRPNLITLDVALPDGTGFEILDWLRSDVEWRDLPAIMVTSSGGADDVMRGLKSGADGYIVKPFQPEVLLACVRRVLNLDSRALSERRSG